MNDDNSKELSIVPGNMESDYIREVRRQITKSWEDTILLSPQELADQITVVGGGRGARVSLQSAKDFVTLVNAMKIPVRLHGQDLIIGVIAGGRITPYITALGEWAQILRDPRTLVSVDTHTDTKPAEGGMFATVICTITMANGQKYIGTDVAYLPSYETFQKKLESYAWDLAAAELGNDSRHSLINDAVTLLTESQRKFNRARAFALRFAETAARRRAMTAARGVLPIVPMANDEIMQDITVANLAELVTLMTGQGMTPDQICAVAGQSLGYEIQSIKQIPNDEETCSAVWRTYLLDRG